jgi:maltose O-acetyltransferase
MSLTDRLRNRLLRGAAAAITHWRLHGLGSCGQQVSVAGPVVFLGRENIRIGNRVSIAGYLHIWGHAGVTIGDDVLIASHAAISSITHDPDAVVFNSRSIGKEVRIGNNVWIGSHAFIGPGIKVGDGSIVGAGAVVLEDVEARTVVGGVPARKLRHLAGRESS